MANIKSAAKRAELAKERNLKNNALRSQMKNVVRKFDESLTAGNLEEAEKNLSKAVSVIDKVEKTGVIKKNTASRKKARLSKALAVAK